MTSQTDNLATPGSPSGLVIVNYGDPAYISRGTADLAPGLGRAENIYLRLLSYALFSEHVAIAGRHVLEGEDMATAVAWLQPLLEEGILVPERRGGVSSFTEVADVRGMGQLEHRRALFLDQHASLIRSFEYGPLSSTYIDLLNSDLAPGGAFRRTVSGGMKGQQASWIDLAHNDHLSTGDGTPDAFVESLARASSNLRPAAWRWAKARYYTTPLLYDSVNTREIPTSAAKLLVKGRVIDSAMAPRDASAPVDATYQRLVANVPAESISTSHRDYCEALLEVRRALPEARKVFSNIRDAAQLKDAGDSLSAMLADELARQQRVKSSKGRMFTFVSSLVGGAGGAALGIYVPGGAESLIGLGSGVVGSIASGAGSNELMNKLKDRKDRKYRPWLLAMDSLDARVKE